MPATSQNIPSNVGNLQPTVKFHSVCSSLWLRTRTRNRGGRRLSQAPTSDWFEKSSNWQMCAAVLCSACEQDQSDDPQKADDRRKPREVSLPNRPSATDNQRPTHPDEGRCFRLVPSPCPKRTIFARRRNKGVVMSPAASTSGVSAAVRGACSAAGHSPT